MPEVMDPVQRTTEDVKPRRPRLFRVLIHNDNYSPAEIVVDILAKVFHLSYEKSVTLMIHTHRTGVGVCGVYTHEVAECKLEKAQALATEAEAPLQFSIEPEEDENENENQ